MGVKGLAFPPQTILWLRDYLTQVGPINPYGFVKFNRVIAAQIEAALTPDLPPVETSRLRDEANARRAAASYGQIRVIFWMLRQVEAIEEDHREPSGKFHPRIYYRIVKPQWFVAGLQTHFYPASKLGGRRYRSYVQRQIPVFPPEPPEGEVNPDRPYERYWEKPPRRPEELPQKARSPRKRRSRGIEAPVVAAPVEPEAPAPRRRRRRTETTESDASQTGAP